MGVNIAMVSLGAPPTRRRRTQPAHDETRLT